MTRTTTTTAKNIQPGQTFHLAGRRGMSPTGHTAETVERVQRPGSTGAADVAIVCAEGKWNLSPNCKVWIEEEVK